MGGTSANRLTNQSGGLIAVTFSVLSDRLGRAHGSRRRRFRDTRIGDGTLAATSAGSAFA